MSLKINFLTLICCSIFTSHMFGQEGKVTINQDKHIAVLLDLKKELNKTENSTDRYKIQVYSGSRAEAESTQSKFNATFSKWQSTIVYEYPNFKIWAGNFNTRLEADRSLKEVKQKFSSAFIFKPKK